MQGSQTTIKEDIPGNLVSQSPSISIYSEFCIQKRLKLTGSYGPVSQSILFGSSNKPISKRLETNITASFSRSWPLSQFYQVPWRWHWPLEIESSLENTTPTFQGGAFDHSESYGCLSSFRVFGCKWLLVKMKEINEYGVWFKYLFLKRKGGDMGRIG